MHSKGQGISDNRLAGTLRLRCGLSSGFDSAQALRPFHLATILIGIVSLHQTASAQIIQLSPVRADRPYDIVDNDLTLPPGEAVVELQIRLAGWGTVPGMPSLGIYQAALDANGYASGSGAPLRPLGWPETPADGAFIVQSICSQSGAPCQVSSDCGPGNGACIANPDYVFADLFPIAIVSTDTLGYVFGGIVTGLCTEDEGVDYYGGTLLVQVPSGAEGTYTIGFASGQSDTFLGDCQGAKLPELTLRPARLTVLSDDECVISGPSSPCQTDCDANGLCDLCELATGASGDCNGNGVPDGCDIASGTSRDCDFSGVPDECEADCNANGQHDLCDIATGQSSDCNGNGVPDDCEPDCQPNGIADPCDLTAGTSDDCNANGVPDDCEPDCQPNGVPDPCELLAGSVDDCNANGIPDECDRDCQPNGVPDDCDLAEGVSDDCNLNGVPDECDEDCDRNGVPDDCESIVAPTIRLRPVGADVAFARCGSGVLIEAGGARVEVELRLSNWAAAPGSPLAAPFPHDGPRNRYLSFDPRKSANDGRPVAFRVRLRSLELGSCSSSGVPCRLDRGDVDCGICSVTRTPCSDAAIDCLPPDQACLPTGEICVNDQGQSIGREWWVGPASPFGNDVHLLVRDPAFRNASDDWPAIVHVADCEIVPRAVFEVTAVDLAHGTESTSLDIATAGKPANGYWADAVGTLSHFCGGSYLGQPCEPGDNGCPADQPCLRAWPPADGLVDFDDIIATVYAFEQRPDRPRPDVSWVDLHGSDATTAAVDPPDYIINFADVQFMALAFEGGAYPFSDPADCPDVNSWP